MFGPPIHIQELRGRIPKQQGLKLGFWIPPHIADGPSRAHSKTTRIETGPSQGITFGTAVTLRGRIPKQQGLKLPARVHRSDSAAGFEGAFQNNKD